MRLLPWVSTLVFSAVALLLLADDASAHRNPDSWPASAPGIHKVCQAIGLCNDRAPRIGPQEPCTIEKSGKVVDVWDERLGAFVRWRCLCVEDGCRWVRIRIVQVANVPWNTPCRRYVIDFHRACASIVCVYEARRHYYRVRGSYFLNC